MNHKVNVKICGLKSKKDVKMCIRLGVDTLGFVTEYPISVPWNLSLVQARELLAFVPSPYQACLVTGGSVEKVIELARALNPSLIQLHYKETLEDTRIIAQSLKPLGIGVIKTMPMTEGDRVRQFGTTDVERIVNLLCNTEIYGILVDSRTPSNVTDPGIKMDAVFFNKIKALSTKPVILAGGITPLNVMEMMERTQAEYVDVMTGVEQTPGVKEEGKLKSLLSYLGRDVIR